MQWAKSMTSSISSRSADRAATGKDSLQLIDGVGKFDEAGLDAFVKAVKLASCGISYAVVAIMGPQSSGKSTLMNHLFATSFKEMDALTGRSQTTQGVWLARAAGIDPCTIVMDLEGTDGRERGEDDTTFEKQSALFALAVSDIVLINMWCHDIGREQAANKPLLKIVFQVMMRLFSPRKTTLLFVIRDKTRTPMEVLEPILRNDIEKIWESAPKPSNFDGVHLSECFNVQVTALASYEEKPEVFKDQVADLRERFNNSIAPGGIAGDRRAVVPGTGFPVSIRSIWKIIKENKDLDLPAHKVMVATVRCEEIAHEKLAEFFQNQDWIELNKSAEAGVVPGFGTKLGVLLDKYISEYDQEAGYFDENVRTTKRSYLVGQALEAVLPAYQAVLAHYRNGVFEKFKQDLKNGANSSDGHEGFSAAVRRYSELAMAEFDKYVADSQVTYAQWDASKVREKLRRDIDSHAALIRTERIHDIIQSSENRLKQNLGEPTGALLDAATPDTWSAIRELLTHEMGQAQACLLLSLSGFELDDTEKSSVLDGLAKFGRTIIENEARKEAAQALLRMKDRFTTSFSHDADALPRLWSDKDDVRKIARDSRSVSLKGLSILAAIRLENMPDQIEPALSTLLDDSRDGTLSRSAAITPDGESSSVLASNPLAASSWDGVAAHNTLLTPIQCRNIWRQFKAETDYSITQALNAQELNKRGNNWMPPPWAIAAIIVLGFNEFMALLRNPLYMLLFFVLYLLGRALWVQLEFGAEFRHGIIPGFLSVSSKILPTFMNYLTKLAEKGSELTEANLTRSNSTASNFPMDMDKTQNFAQQSDFPLAMDEMQKSDHSDITDESSVRNRRPRKAVEVAH